MQESSGGKRETPETESDATSKETLKDVEADEPSSVMEDYDEGESAIPAPDGAFEDMSESKETGPI